MNIYKIKSAEHKGTFFAILSGLMYGLLGYFGMRLLATGLTVPSISFWRFSIAFLFLFIIYLLKIKKTHPWRQNLFALINGGIFYGMPGNLFFVASQYIGTGQAMVIFFIFPIFVMLLNWIFFKQKIKSYYFISFILIITGLVMMTDLSDLTLDFAGISLSLLAALSYAIYIVLGKRVSLPPLESSLMVSLGCTVACAILAMITSPLSIPHSFEQWSHILGLGIICSALPILLLFEALKYISSEKASLLSVLEPVFVVFFGVLLLEETLTLYALSGIMLILCGVLSVSMGFKLPFLRPKFLRS